PEFFVALAPLESFIDRRMGFRGLTRPFVGACQFGDESTATQGELCFRKFPKAGAQGVLSADEVAPIDVQNAVETTPKSMPDTQRKCRRVTKQHRHITLCRRQVARQKRDGACAKTEGNTRR